MRSADEAYAYLTNLKELMRYSEISDCDMEKGQLRCDVNISLRPVGAEKFGTKIEMKNLNSFRAVHRAIESEIERQAELLDAGTVLKQETRGWDDEAGSSYLMRTKESAHDYRYFPDPDLMPVTFTDEDIEAIRATLPEQPEAKRARFVADFGLTAYDAEVLTADRKLAAYFDECAKSAKNPKAAANWIISTLLSLTGAAKVSVDACPVTPAMLAELVNFVESGKISGKIAKDLLPEMFESGKTAAALIEEKGLTQMSDSSAIAGIVTQALDANAKQVAEYLAGNERVLQYFVGQVMKLSKGRANPGVAIAELKKQLAERN